MNCLPYNNINFVHHTAWPTMTAPLKKKWYEASNRVNAKIPVVNFANGKF